MTGDTTTRYGATKLAVYAGLCVRLAVVALLVLSTACANILDATRGSIDAETANLAPTELAVYDSAINRLPPPVLLEGIGRSELTIGTDSPLAQQYFNSGVALLHDFWEFEAYRAFAYAAQLDPSAAMPHWGIYMAASRMKRWGSVEREQQQAAALHNMRLLRDAASEREQLYIDAILNSAGLGWQERRSQYTADLEYLIDRYPDELEAKLLLANHLIAGYAPDGRPRSGQLYSEALLQNLLRSHPRNHAVHHYWIHAMEMKRPAQALESAKIVATLAPASGHIVHMPGHVYYRLGQYQRAHEQFLQALEVDQRYMREQGIKATDNWNYVHNLYFLLANSAEQGRYREGRQWAALLEELAYEALDSGAYARSYMIFQGLFAPARFELRFANWHKAWQLLEAIELDDEQLGAPLAFYRHAVILYAKGMDAVNSNALVDAAQFASELEALLKLRQSQEQYPSIYAKIIAVSVPELRGHIASAMGMREQAVSFLKDAAQNANQLGYKEPPWYSRTVEESLAEIYLAAGRLAEAEQSYQALLQRRPHSGYAYYGLAKVLEAAEDIDRAQAAAAYARFLESWPLADPSLERVRHARRQLQRYSAQSP